MNVFERPVPFPDPCLPARPFPANMAIAADSLAVDHGQVPANVNDGGCVCAIALVAAAWAAMQIGR